jgi:thymidine kinase
MRLKIQLNRRTRGGLMRHSGKIEVVVGCMFSGKTEELIRRVRRAHLAKQRVQVFKPTIDVRYSEDEVASHSSQRIPSTTVSRAQEILEKLDDSTRVVGIDEGQFFDEAIVDVVNKLANRGLRVIVAGLDMDWKGEPFNHMPALMAVAEEVIKQHAVCMSCGEPATRTQRLRGTDGKIQVGAAEAYEARCRSCHETDLQNLRFSPRHSVELI